MNAARFRAAHPICIQCGAPTKIADHRIPRDVLIARGVANPDAWEWLQPLCQTCHNRKTVREQKRK
jgi:5-methylcytosine-specific restriction endonuclease McrA